MGMTDPLADMFTRIRNASNAGHEKVDIPSSSMKVSIAEILKSEGFINNYKVISDNKQGVLRIYLKYNNGTPVINNIVKISKPGLRNHVGVGKIPEVKKGYGTAILTTSKGILTDKDAKKNNVGGELICKIW